MQDKPVVNPRKTLAILAWVVTLAVVWLLWSGLYKPLLISLGAFSCLLTVYIIHRTGFFDGPTLLHAFPRMPKFLAFLFVEIIKSNIYVTKIILSPKLSISPTEVDIKAEPKGPVGQAILGNAITTTPGTLTMDVYEGVLRIHCLTKDGAEALVESDINQRTADLTEK